MKTPQQWMLTGLSAAGDTEAFIAAVQADARLSALEEAAKVVGDRAGHLKRVPSTGDNKHDWELYARWLEAKKLLGQIRSLATPAKPEDK